mmetsp:Transcript_18043/g.68088  ORF Transcript_18043/g.68088 Transcript_18043/m.68088 type:complete len:241 (-) Transcript_18043:547-1269(-)
MRREGAAKRRRMHQYRMRGGNELPRFQTTHWSWARWRRRASRPAAPQQTARTHARDTPVGHHLELEALPASLLSSSALAAASVSSSSTASPAASRCLYLMRLEARSWSPITARTKEESIIARCMSFVSRCRDSDSSATLRLGRSASIVCTLSTISLFSGSVPLATSSRYDAISTSRLSSPRRPSTLALSAAPSSDTDGSFTSRRRCSTATSSVSDAPISFGRCSNCRSTTLASVMTSRVA